MTARRRPRFLLGTLTLASGLGLAGPAAAAVSFYTSQAGFLAALSAASLEDFSDATLNPGLSIVGGSVSIDSGRLRDAVNDNNQTSTTFLFAAPINGFGGRFNLAVPGGPGTGIRVAIDLVVGGVTALSQEIPNTIAGGFWGFVSTIAFDEVRFSEGSQAIGKERYRLDNLRYGVLVPEPGTVALFGAGLLLLGAAWRGPRVAVLRSARAGRR